MLLRKGLAIFFLFSNFRHSFGHSILNQKFSFCSENKGYAFTTAACPGGVLFKEPVLIDEPCHCFDSDLLIFEGCESRNSTSGHLISQTGSSCSKYLTSPTGKNILGLRAQLFLPSESKPTSTSVSRICHGLPNHCKQSKENTAFQNPGFIINEIEESSPFLSPRKGRKVITEKSHESDYSRRRRRRDVESTTFEPDIDTSTDSSTVDPPADSSKESKSKSEESTTNSSNEPETKTKAPSKSKISSKSKELSEEELEEKREEITKMLKMLETIERNAKGLVKPYASNPAEMKIFKILDKTFEIFKKLAPDNVIRDEIVDQIFEVFKAKMLNDMDLFKIIVMDEKMGSEMFEDVYSALVACHRNIQIDEFVFENSDHCPPRLGKLVGKNGGVGVGEILKRMPSGYEYLPEKEDMILGATWKVMAGVHARCYGTWTKIGMARVPFFFWSFLENFFLTDIVAQNFYPAREGGTSMYEAFIESDRDFSWLMKNIDTLVGAIHTRSAFPGYFHKPTKQDTKSKEVSNSDARRKKRSVEKEDFEIWGGRAYCLQKLDLQKPAGFHNSFPKITYLCQN